MHRHVLITSATILMTIAGQATAQPYYVNKTIEQMRDIAHGRLRVTIGATTTDVYDVSFKHAADFNEVASRLHDAFTAAGLSITVTYQDTMLRFYSSGGDVHISAGVQRDNEHQHLMSYNFFLDMGTYPDTYGLSPDTFDDGDWSAYIDFGNYDHLIGDLGIKRHIVMWPFGELPGDGYAVGQYPIGAGTLYCAPMGPPQLAILSNTPVSTFADSWGPVVEAATAIGGEVICYYGSVPTAFRSDPIEWASVPISAGMSIAQDVMGGIDTTTDPAPPALEFASELAESGIVLYCEPHDLTISQLAPWHSFGAFSNWTRCDVVDQYTGYYFAQDGLDNIAQLVAGQYDDIAVIKADYPRWIKRGWTACFPMQAYLSWSDTDLAAMRDMSWDTDFIGDGVIACYANCDGSTTSPILNVADYTCFLGRVAASDPRANCDGSTTSPILNVADYTCFLTRVAAGCP